MTPGRFSARSHFYVLGKLLVEAVLTYCFGGKNGHAIPRHAGQQTTVNHRIPRYRPKRKNPLPPAYSPVEGGFSKVPPAGFEPATHGVETHCSNPLSYGGLQRTHSSPRGRGNLSQGALRRAQDVHQVLGSCGQLAIRAVGHDGVVARQVISNGAGDDAVRLHSRCAIGHDTYA